MRIAAALVVVAPAIALAKPVSIGVISRDEPPFATRAEAAKATIAAGSGELISVRVVAEHGDVIEVSCRSPVKDRPFDEVPLTMADHDVFNIQAQAGW